MIRSRRGLLGLCAVVLGVMAFVASAAQAESTAKWLILKGTTAVDAAFLPATVVGELENKHGTLLTKIIGLSVGILCEGVTFSGVTLIGQGSLPAGAQFIFSGCTVTIGGKKEAACTPKGGGGALGTIKTNKGKGLAVLIGGAKRILFEPETKEGPFATIEFGEECVLPTAPIFGKLYIKDCKGDIAFAEHFEKHLWEEDTVNSKLWAISDTAEHLQTSLDGSLEAFLAGEHKGLKWGGDV
jgi:hypothetical protein